MSELVREITRCRACGSDRLDPVLDLGTHCISDFVDDGQEPDKAPLTLLRCHDCTLVQLQHTVDRDRLYRRYWYKSGTNESMVVALRDVVKDAMGRVDFECGDRVVDIGANDGTLLRTYGKVASCTGFEPAEQFASDLSWMGPGDTWLKTYFPAPEWVEPTPAKIITSCAVFYDLDDPGAFVAGIKDWLHPDGVWVCQMMDLHQMLIANAFDNICHEHLAYYSYRSFSRLVRNHGLYIDDMSMNDVNGGSVRFIVKHGWKGTPPPDDYMLDTDADGIKTFAKRVRWLRNDTTLLLDHFHGLCWAYGASTKGNTLLQYYGLGPKQIAAIADRNPDKWGKKTVGTNIPIVSEADWRAANPSHTLVLPWHFIEPFKVREADYLRGGGTFILPLPKLREVTYADCQPAPTPAVAGA